MKFKTAQYEKHWSSTVADMATTIGSEDARANIAKLEMLLSTVMLSENLVILAGLGTSLCIADPADISKSLAPTMSDLWQAAKDKAHNFDDILIKVKQPQSGNITVEDIELLLSRCQMTVALNDDIEVKSFVKLIEDLIVEKCRFLGALPLGAGLPAHESFLRKVARRPARQSRAKLFTTNYDLCFETAAARAGFVVIDGFSHTNPQDFDGNYFSYDIVTREGDQDSPKYIANVFQLLKLHGSVDWNREDDGKVRRSENPARPVIIYPRRGKFESSYDQPYLEMMSRFQFSLRQPNTGLVVVGFGFNDRHIVQPILASLRSNSSLRAIIVGPGYESTPSEEIKKLEKLIDDGDRRITLIDGRFEDLAAAIPDLVAETDDEQHRRRVAKVLSK